LKKIGKKEALFPQKAYKVEKATRKRRGDFVPDQKKSSTSSAEKGLTASLRERKKLIPGGLLGYCSAKL